MERSGAGGAMDARPRRAPHPWRLVALWRLAALMIGLLAHPACVKIDGGAIEASWVLRTFDGRAVSGCECSDPEITRVRFVAVTIDSAGNAGADACAGQVGCEFSCASQRGATPFFLPEARYAVSVQAIDRMGAPVPATGTAGGVRLQAPILRDVAFGQPVQLEAFAIEVSCAAVCGGVDATRACRRD